MFCFFHVLVLVLLFYTISCFPEAPSFCGIQRQDRTWLDRMFLKQVDLTTALRPAYLPDEVLLYVQDNVGLYEG